MIRKLSMILVLGGMVGYAAVSLAGDDKAKEKPKTIVETAVAAGQFKTLVKAIEAAELVDTLNAPGPFTVFAPTDEAFAKLPAGALDGLLKDKAKLKTVLTYLGGVTLFDWRSANSKVTE